MSETEAQQTLDELLEAMSSNQTTIQDINDPIILKEIEPMKKIIEAALKIEEILKKDPNNDKSVEDVDESVKKSVNVKLCTGQKREMTVQDIDTSTNTNAKKSRRETKTTTGQDEDITHDKPTSIKDKTKMTTKDKELNETSLHQELAVECQEKSTQDIIDIGIEKLQENQCDNYIEIEISQRKELSESKTETQNPIDTCLQLIAIQTPVPETGHREVDTYNETELPIMRIGNPIEDTPATQLEQDLQTIQETLLPEDKQKLEFDVSFKDETEQAEQETKTINETLEGTTETVEKSTQPIEENTHGIEEDTQSIDDTTEDESKTSEYIKDTNFKDIPKSVFDKFCTSHVSYVNKNKEKGKFLYHLIHILILDTGF